MRLLACSTNLESDGWDGCCRFLDQELAQLRVRERSQPEPWLDHTSREAFAWAAKKQEEESSSKEEGYCKEAGRYEEGSQNLRLCTCSESLTPTSVHAFKISRAFLFVMPVFFSC